MRTWCRIVLSLAVAIVLCPFTSARASTYDLELVRSRADEMSARILEALYETDAYGEESTLAEIASEYPDLADPELARYACELRDAESDPRRRKQLDYLFFDIVGTVIYQDLADIEDALLNAEAEGVVVVSDEELAYRDVGVRLYNEADSDRREQYYLAIGEFDVRETNPLRAELVRRTREGLRKFGYSDLDEFEADRRNLDHDAFEETVMAFLDDTREAYWELTNAAAVDAFGVGVVDVKDYDRGRLFRGSEFDEYFPADRMVPLLKEVLLGLGVDLDALPMIHLDDENRPEKEPRAASYCVRPGEDVRILLKPVGGAYDYESLYHEMFHALHDAFVAVDEYEFQRLGDYGVTEAYAYLAEDLLSDPLFLDHWGLMEDSDVRRRFLRSQLMSDLGSARYYAGLFRYERLLHGGELSDAELVGAYGDIMKESRLVALERPSFDYLVSNEDFYGVNYLEAWFLAAQLRAVLVERFGEKWWASEQAGALLKELWAFGAEKSATEIAQHMGYAGLDPSFYIREIERGFAAYR